MNGVLRRERIIAMLRENNSKAVSELADAFQVSMMTIRRDLELLEKSGVIKKLHGSAVMAAEENAWQQNFYERSLEMKSQKVSIAAEAVKQITPGCVAFFDAGTTALEMADLIPDHIEFTAITLGLMTAVRLCGKPNINVINIGGDLHKPSFSTAGFVACENIRRFKADVCFITTSAFTYPDGSYDSTSGLIETKRTVVESSKRVVMLVNSLKFERTSLSLSIPLKSIDVIITDAITDELRAKLEDDGVEVIISQ